MTGWKIGLLQIVPELGRVERNTTKLLELTSKLQPGKIDLLCLPEMVLSGYTFPSAESIRPYLEHPRIGPTSLCCSKLAKKLRCHVIAGYPENLSQHEIDSSEGVVGYNSAIIYGPNGEWKGGYRKTNLFITDSTWARAGDGFGLLDLGPPIGQVSLGICMDLNPQPPAIWTSNEGPFELASFTLNNDARLLVLLCAWLDSKENPEDKWDRQTVSYWLARLLPLWKCSDGEQIREDTIVAICNRAGAEGDTLFAGTSTLVRMSQTKNSPQIIGLMRRDEEGVRVWEV